MKYGSVAGIPIPVSRLVQGTMMFSTENLDDAFAMFDAAFEQGCTAYDTAHVYGGGDSERVLGQWLAARDLRDKVVVISKGAHPNEDRNRVTPFDIASDLYDSLARLKTDFIDLYLLHRDDPELPVGPIVEALNEHLEDGRIRAFGGSNWTHRRIEEANAYAHAHGLTPFAASSPHFSFVEQVIDPWGGCVTLTGPAAVEARDWYVTTRMPVLAWSSLAHGFLSGVYTRQDIEAFPEDCEEGFIRWYRSEANLTRLDRAFELAGRKGCSLPQIATAYVLHQDMDVYPLVGCTHPGEFQANAQALDIRLSQAELAYLDLA